MEDPDRVWLGGQGAAETRPTWCSCSSARSIRIAPIDVIPAEGDGDVGALAGGGEAHHQGHGRRRRVPMQRRRRLLPHHPHVRPSFPSLSPYSSFLFLSSYSVICPVTSSVWQDGEVSWLNSHLSVHDFWFFFFSD